MRLIRFAPGPLLFLALCASAAFGQVQRTLVSGSGSDSNPCSTDRALPHVHPADAGTDAFTIAPILGHSTIQIVGSLYSRD